MPAITTVSEQKIAAHYETLDEIGLVCPSRTKGYLRAGYSPEEQAVIDYFKDHCTKLGLAIRFDGVGNFTAETSSPSGRYIEFGSHVDTVPYGGNFDGLAGVVAGFEAIRAHVENGTTLQHGLRLRIWRLEESSCYGASCFGSSAAFGIANKSALENPFRGVKLRDAMQDQGYDPSFIADGIPTILQPELDSILAHVELHIEQANSLELNECDIGIVTSIRGPTTLRYSIEGSFNHSGGTPYGDRFRRDANLAVAYMQVELDNLLKRYIADGRDIIHTVAQVNSEKSVNDSDPRVYASSPAKVCGFSYFTLNIRCADEDLRNEYCRAAEVVIQEVAKKRDVSALSLRLNQSPGIKAMNAQIISHLKVACGTAAVSSQAMPSGAMHDAAVVGRRLLSSEAAVPVGMIFIPCRNGISHSPDEFASHDAIAKGARVLEEFVASFGRS